MHGLDILVATMSVPGRTDTHGNTWNYHSRSDHHSKVACWCIIFDLLRTCPVFRGHVAAGKVGFGINHRLRDFQNDRAKNLDLIICTPSSSEIGRKLTLIDLAKQWQIVLTPSQEAELASLPTLNWKPVGSVLVALEAKACMTSHQKALPRLYDELNSSHLTVHGASNQAIAAGFVMVNAASTFLSPDLNKKYRATAPEWSTHPQPKFAQIAIDKVRQLPRRSRPNTEGYDALAIAVIDCVNDGSPVGLVAAAPAPQPGDTYHYASMVERLCNTYSTRFGHL